MRVIGGSAKGRKLQAPKGLATRPTPDRVREALFSIIAAYVPCARVCDVYAGSGALGIESLSRGAHSAVFIDNDRHALAALRQNTAFFAARCRILSMGALPALRSLASGPTFDIMFVDPPYKQNLWARTLASILEFALLAPEGIIVCEHPGAGPDLAAPEGLHLWRKRGFGDVALSIYASTGPHPPDERVLP